ncbi:MAG: transcription termination/antitermination protein NusG [Porcipelethomonas sp.]
MMYVIHTKTGSELSSSNALKRLGYNIKTPEKIMNIRCGGVWKQQRYLVFTGYIFLETDSELKPADYYKIKNADGVINFIGGGNPQTLSAIEEKYINWLWNDGKPIGPSKVYVTSEGMKMLMSGPLKRYGGELAAIDVRQKRAKVFVPICGRQYKVTLPIEFI